MEAYIRLSNILLWLWRGRFQPLPRLHYHDSIGFSFCSSYRHDLGSGHNQARLYNAESEYYIYRTSRRFNFKLALTFRSARFLMILFIGVRSSLARAAGLIMSWSTVSSSWSRSLCKSSHSSRSLCVLTSAVSRVVESFRGAELMGA